MDKFFIGLFVGAIMSAITICCCAVNQYNKGARDKEKELKNISSAELDQVKAERDSSNRVGLNYLMLIKDMKDWIKDQDYITGGKEHARLIFTADGFLSGHPVITEMEQHHDPIKTNDGYIPELKLDLKTGVMKI